MGYDYLILLVPLVLTAPLFFAGDLDMGGVIQAGASFGRVLGALSIIVHHFMLFSELSAGAQRLVTFDDVLNEHHLGYGENGIKTVIAEGVSVENLSIKTPDSSATIISNVNFELEQGGRLLIVGPSGVGKSTILKALAGQRKEEAGASQDRPADDVMFLPQTPYMPPGTLRSSFSTQDDGRHPAIANCWRFWKALNLEDLAKRNQGLDAEQDWDEGMSGGQHQRIAIARMLIARLKLAILDEATSGLDDENEERVYEMIRASGITAVSVAHRQADRQTSRLCSGD